MCFTIGTWRFDRQFGSPGDPRYQKGLSQFQAAGRSGAGLYQEFPKLHSRLQAEFEAIYEQAQMLHLQSPGSGACAQDQPSVQTSLTQLVLFAASPGTITRAITLAVAHSRTDLPVTALVASAVTIVVTFCVMLLLAFLGGKNKVAFSAKRSPVSWA